MAFFFRLGYAGRRKGDLYGTGQDRRLYRSVQERGGLHPSGPGGKAGDQRPGGLQVGDRQKYARRLPYDGAVQSAPHHRQRAPVRGAAGPGGISAEGGGAPAGAAAAGGGEKPGPAVSGMRDRPVGHSHLSGDALRRHLCGGKHLVADGPDFGGGRFPGGRHCLGPAGGARRGLL